MVLDMNSLDELESAAIGFLSQHISNQTYVSVSGGKDSLVVLDLAIRAGIRKAVYCNTTIEFPQTVEYISVLKSFYNIPIDVVSAGTTFFEMCKQVGFPSRRLRWCCDVFKFGPLAKFARQKGVCEFITGLRRDESHSRKNYTYLDNNPLVPARQLNPILDWKEEDVWNYIRRYSLPVNSLYDIFERNGCWCCPFKSEEEWKKTEEFFPKLMILLEMELEKYADRIGIRNKHQFIQERGWTSWASPITKLAVGTYAPCNRGNNGQKSVILRVHNNEQVRRIKQVLPIITDDYGASGRILRITYKAGLSRKLNTLVEKAINCIGCGTCVLLCPTQALRVDSKELVVSSKHCTHCFHCLNAHGPLRGSCVVRNYADNRSALVRK